MPFKDTDKRKKYYDRTQKGYIKKWRSENTDLWNDYQKKYKVRKRLESTEQIKNAVKELNIGEPEEIVFKCAVVLFIVITQGIKKDWAIAYRTGYSLLEVKLFFQNWESNGIYKDGFFLMDKCDNEFEENIQFTLFSLVGSGEIVCRKMNIL